MSFVSVIGAGFSGLSAAAYLAKEGHEVHVFEKNSTVGGRARQMISNGYLFDMGPSWYWMPDVFEKFFNDFGYNPSDFYQLQLLDPAFDIVFGKDDIMRIPADFEELCRLFENIETGSAHQLKKFMKEAEQKYRLSMDEFIYRPGLSLWEYLTLDTVKKSVRLSIFSSFSNHVRKYFSHPKLIAIMEFPVLFLGAMPDETPALYSLMNYAGLKLGTWYPQGGFGQVAGGFMKIAKDLGVKFHFNSTVEEIIIKGDSVSGIRVNGEQINSDGVIASADYHHVEQKLLPKQFRNYSDEYWGKKVFAPSCLVFYIGVNKKIKGLNHHTLFFDKSMEKHSHEIYKSPAWPADPLFYLSCTSKSDGCVAPEGHENLFVLIPLAPGLQDDNLTREKYFKIIIDRIENYTGENISGHIDFRRNYCINDFVSDYNSYKGNAYGLANTLSQTASFRPSIANKKIKNLFYAGQLTVPGPGVPPAIISGKISATLLLKQLKKMPHEVVV